MKNLSQKLIELFSKGYCSPQATNISRLIKEPLTTIHYNIKKLEENGTIKGYRAILDYKKLNKSFCSFVLINLSKENYSEPDEIGKHIAEYKEIESVDIITGDYEMIIKVRTKDVDEYYEFMKKIVKKFNIEKSISVTSLKQIKSEFLLKV